MKTTIQINQSTLERLKSLKRFERESYDELINIIADEYEDDELSPEEISEIQESLEDIKKNGTIPFDKVLKDAGIKLR